MKTIKLFYAIVGIILTIFCLLLFGVLSHRNLYDIVPSDAIIVLGHALDDDNNPSPWLEARLDCAIDLYSLGYADVIIVSGGRGPTDNIPVAYAMKAYLIYNGVPQTSILTETMSGNTYQNFKYSGQLALEHDINSIIVVTNDFHMYRSLLIADWFFDEVTGYTATLDINFSWVLAVLREPFSIVMNYIFIRMV